MTKVLETKACNACAAAKRKCGKQMPHCLRCRTRGIKCAYPAKKPSSFVLCRGEDTALLHAGLTLYNAPQIRVHSLGLQTTQTGGDKPSLRPDPCELSGCLLNDQHTSSWFTSQETWKVHMPVWDQNLLYVASDLKRYVQKICRWLTDWIETGSTPFIHARLYQTRYPRCIQDAYTTLACYLHRTALNEQTVFHIIENRIKDLVPEDTFSSDSLPDNNAANSTTLDSLEHIARVHALLIYQIIGLYDGDIRLRHLSETCIPVLNSWLQAMIQHTRQSTSADSSVISSAYEKAALGGNPSTIAEDENLWYSWILAETARRTWIVASGIHVVFTTIRQGGSIPACNGGMVFTTRRGAWEAKSAFAWEKLCAEEYTGLIQMAEAGRLFTEVAPDEVNEFAKMVLELTFGREKMERWGAQRDDW